MKKLSFFNKIIFLINTVFAVSLVISFILPYLPPKKFGVIALLSLLVPILIIGNVIFIFYWLLIGFKKQFLQSFIVIIASYFFIPTLYKLNNDSNNLKKDQLSILTYNVRKFNKYNWIHQENIDKKIDSFISQINPDIVAIQEFRVADNFKLSYPYYSNPPADNYSNPVENKKHRISLAMYSKYPIINEGIIKYTKTHSSSMYIDIIKNNDTIRIYNFHLASLGVDPDKDYFGHDGSKKLIKRLNYSFKVQQKQIDTLLDHHIKCKYKSIMVGDMNNTAYSWAYKTVKNNLQDTFLEAGKGFGKTYEFKRFPLRIDYILVDQKIKVINHTNYKKQFSDHFPVMATLKL